VQIITYTLLIPFFCQSCIQTVIRFTCVQDHHLHTSMKRSLTDYSFHISVSPVFGQSCSCVQGHHLPPINFAILSVLYSDSHTLVCKATTYNLSIPYLSVLYPGSRTLLFKGHHLHPVQSVSLSVLYSDNHTLVCKAITYSLSISYLCQSCIQIIILLCARPSLTAYPFRISVSPVFR
jgi:hypothetical protein